MHDIRERRADRGKQALLYRGACEEEGELYRGACSCITCMTCLLSEVAVIRHDKSALTSTEEISAGKCDDGMADRPLAFSLLRCTCRGHQTRRALQCGTEEEGTRRGGCDHERHDEEGPR